MAIYVGAAYAKDVREDMGNPQVTYNKFHVSQDGVEECNKFRKLESRADVGKRHRLERIHWMWLKSRAK